jgi:hypothetical protein
VMERVKKLEILRGTKQGLAREDSLKTAWRGYWS